MSLRNVDSYREKLAGRRDQMRAWLEQASEQDRARISDGMMDASAETDGTVIAELENALERVEEGSFGVCIHGDGDVEEERLILDFTTCVCLSHYDDAQIRALEKDLEYAARVQQHLFPHYVPVLDGVQIASHAVAGRIVGGDYFDYFRFSDDAQGTVIADVMGSGVAAGMVVANLQASLRIVGEEYEMPDQLAARLNRLFRYNLRVPSFISMVLVRFDFEADRFHFTNAGHNPPLFWSARERSVRWLAPTGPAIGLMPDPPFRCEAVDTATDDLLILYTDGVVEARAPKGDPFGEGRLQTFLEEHAHQGADDVASNLWRAIERHSSGALGDDAAIMVARFT